MSDFRHRPARAGRPSTFSLAFHPGKAAPPHRTAPRSAPTPGPPRSGTGRTSVASARPLTSTPSKERREKHSATEREGRGALAPDLGKRPCLASGTDQAPGSASARQEEPRDGNARDGTRRPGKSPARRAGPLPTTARQRARARLGKRPLHSCPTGAARAKAPKRTPPTPLAFRSRSSTSGRLLLSLALAARSQRTRDRRRGGTGTDLGAAPAPRASARRRACETAPRRTSRSHDRRGRRGRGQRRWESGEGGDGRDGRGSRRRGETAARTRGKGDGRRGAPDARRTHPPRARTAGRRPRDAPPLSRSRGERRAPGPRHASRPAPNAGRGRPERARTRPRRTGLLRSRPTPRRGGTGQTPLRPALGPAWGRGGRTGRERGGGPRLRWARRGEGRRGRAAAPRAELPLPRRPAGAPPAPRRRPSLFPSPDEPRAARVFKPPPGSVEARALGTWPWAEGNDPKAPRGFLHPPGRPTGRRPARHGTGRRAEGKPGTRQPAPAPLGGSVRPRGRARRPPPPPRPPPGARGFPL